ncbi:hypothetical protein TWF506_009237 [Arthrobotrys conoides]|uniref:Uncharacterized protein n=1 Tax=Arthrobotrys conoides TaxID=74498 RepID=A0AAN8RM61_9PEZI
MPEQSFEAPKRVEQRLQINSNRNAQGFQPNYDERDSFASQRELLKTANARPYRGLDTTEDTLSENRRPANIKPIRDSKRKANSVMVSHWLEEPESSGPYYGLGSWDVDRRRF